MNNFGYDALCFKCKLEVFQNDVKYVKGKDLLINYLNFIFKLELKLKCLWCFMLGYFNSDVLKYLHYSLLQFIGTLNWF